MAELDWHYPILALVGGILGAGLGALPSFILCGIFFIIGTIIFLITGDQSFNMVVTWGPVIGPHTAFAGGIAAAAYAARRGRLESGRNILKPLYSLKSISVFLVGALFGLLGLLFTWAATLIPTGQGISWVNPIALSITLNGMLTRLILGKTGLLGYRAEKQSLWIPSREENVFPWHMPPFTLLLMSLGLSVPTAFLALYLPQVSGLLFGLAAVSLILIVFGCRIPVVLHIILAVQLVAASTGNIWWGVSFGILAALLADIFVCLFLDRGDTHIDPAALALTAIYSLYPLLFYLGVFQLDYIWSVLAVAAVTAGGYVFLAGLKR